jgi:hypothetical protein
MPAAPHVPPDDHATQQDQQRRHEELGGGPQSGRQLNPQGDNQQGDHAHRDGMADPPDQSEAGSAPEALPPRASGQRGDGRKMVRLKGMPQAQQATNSHNGYNRRRHLCDQI